MWSVSPYRGLRSWIRRATCRALRRGRSANISGRQTVKETITSYVGLDIHKASVALAIADAGRAVPRFIGTINPSPAELCKALRRQQLRPRHTLLGLSRPH